MPSSLLQSLRFIVATCVACLALSVSAAPTNVLIRVPAGTPVPAELPGLLAQWRQSGQVGNVLLLTQGRPEHTGDKAVFESLTVLEFPNEQAYAAWQRDCAAALPAGLIVRQADALTHGEITPRDSNRSVFLVGAYTPTVPKDGYDDYTQNYIAPLMQGVRAAKYLVRYTMYLERAKVGQAQAFLVQEYRDSVAFEAGSKTKAAVRTQLEAGHAGYQKYAKIKSGLRSDDGGTFADYTELPPPDLSDLPGYQPEVKIAGSLRIVGSELKNATDQLAAGFRKFHPAARVSTNFMTSSEGGIAGLYCGISDVAPMGDDAKITDVMPFYNTFGYMPTEISVATGGSEKRGSLWAWAIVVGKDNPLEEISLDELECVFGAERTGGWELVNNNYLYTAKHARGPETNIRKWDQLGLKGEFAGREIETFGYCAQGFETAIMRTWFHWSGKWNPNFKQYVEAKQATPDAAGAAVASERPLEDLSRNKYSIGIAALMHVKDYPDVKVLRISRKKGGPAIALTPENVANRTYPLIRDAYFYVNKAPGQPLDPKVREFMRFVLSREGQEIIARVGYYYPLPADYIKEQLKKLD